jgi:hypothetical protein
MRVQDLREAAEAMNVRREQYNKELVAIFNDDANPDHINAGLQYAETSGANAFAREQDAKFAESDRLWSGCWRSRRYRTTAGAARPSRCFGISKISGRSGQQSTPTARSPGGHWCRC